MLIAIVVALVIAALILMLATRVVEKFTPSVGKALVTQIVIGIAGVIVSIVLRLVLHGLSGTFVAAIVNFFVGAWIIQQLITGPGGAVADGGAMAMTAGGKMSYGHACLIALIEYIIYIVIGVIVGIVFGGAMMAALHH
ncbi:MAG TPA: hypothetical protein VFP88_05080 [Rhodanobacteraceae bacterium]|nr:hypothetical protein [Rhodanobacteraceae bacterium]